MDLSHGCVHIYTAQCTMHNAHAQCTMLMQDDIGKTESFSHFFFEEKMGVLGQRASPPHDTIRLDEEVVGMV